MIKQKLKSIFLGTISCVLFVYIMVIILLFFMQRSLIYLPDQTPPIKPTPDITAYITDIHLATTDHINLSAWFLPPPPTEQTKIIILFHGNRGNISNRIHKASQLQQAGYGVLLAEYRGYGGNAGTPTEKNLYIDARAYIGWIKEQGYTNDQIILYGESLGSGVAVHMASEQRDIHALILETPYSRLTDIATARYPFIPYIDLLMHDQFKSIDKIAALKMPKLFLIAGEDEVTGMKTGLNLFEQSPSPKSLKLYKNGKHNTLYTLGAAHDIISFLKDIE